MVQSGKPQQARINVTQSTILLTNPLPNVSKATSCFTRTYMPVLKRGKSKWLFLHSAKTSGVHESLINPPCQCLFGKAQD